MPSITTKPKGSFLEGITDTSDKDCILLTSSVFFLPTKCVFCKPNLPVCSFNSPSNCPEPTINVNGFIPCSCNSPSYLLAASNNTSIPLKSANFPTKVTNLS